MRCNVGINPMYLLDQHLIAEQVELLMVPGFIRRMDGKIKVDNIPDSFRLNKGHILFFVDKLSFLRTRHECIKAEVRRRGFKVTDKNIDPLEFDIPQRLYFPNLHDTHIVRKRIVEKIMAKNGLFWRYNKLYEFDMIEKINNITNGELFYV